ncbi:MAG: Lipoprotein A family protein [Candidatus Peregrinibacteria bacterium GW2011_GWA2_38_36]|nr:MAG: Lipoprotein A family protein [Candidatus Peregrinibacteria bacterium GW2011_GWA2_38_36]
MQRKFQIAALISTITICVITPLILTPFLSAKAEEIKLEPYFKDVPEGYPYFTAIQYLKSEELIDDKDENFNPDAQISRAEAVNYILRVTLGYVPNEKATIKPFSDVPLDSVNAMYVQKAKELKLVNGYNARRFQPNKKISLAEATKIVLETDKLVDATITFEQPKEDVFADVPKNAWFSPYAKIAKERRIIRFGKSDEISPNDLISKGYLMDILYRTKKYHAGYTFGIASFYDKKFEGRKTSSGEIFTHSKLTAAHRTLKFGTRLRVTNLKNSKSVEVTVNDRGPYTKNFEIDLSESAFTMIGEKSNGIIPVQIEVLPEPTPEK